MKKDIKSLNYEICVDTDGAKEKLDEIKKIIDSIEFHFNGLKKAVNDLENYNSNFEIKYSLDACSIKSCQILKDELILRRFKLINEKNKDKLLALIEEKNLSREDLILILSSISLNQDIHLQFY